MSINGLLRALLVWALKWRVKKICREPWEDLGGFVRHYKLHVLLLMCPVLVGLIFWAIMVVMVGIDAILGIRLRYAFDLSVSFSSEAPMETIRPLVRFFLASIALWEFIVLCMNIIIELRGLWKKQQNSQFPAGEGAEVVGKKFPGATGA